jgi:hypothetical protein
LPLFTKVILVSISFLFFPVSLSRMSI